jgi:hypothetical protein
MDTLRETDRSQHSRSPSRLVSGISTVQSGSATHPTAIHSVILFFLYGAAAHIAPWPPLYEVP